MARATGVVTAATLGLAVQFQAVSQCHASSSSNQGHHEVIPVSSESARLRLALQKARLQKTAGQQQANATIFSVEEARRQINNSTSLEGLGIRVKHLPAPIAAGGHNIRERQLQSSCYSGWSFNIASSLFPFLDGCYSVLTDDTSGGEVIYWGMDTLVAALPSSEDEDPIYLWAAVYVDGSGDLTLDCLAAEDASTIHPSEGTWLCEIDGDLVQPTATQFSASCGCSSDSSTSSETTPAPITATTPTPIVSTTPSPITAATPTPIVSTTPSPITATTSTPVASTTSSSPLTPTGTCAEGGSFLVSSSIWGEVEGCYSVNGYMNGGQLIYSLSGTAEFHYPWMYAYTPSERSPSNIIWKLELDYESTSSSQSVTYCFSDESSDIYHPADVTLWWCDFTGSGTYFEASSTAFSADCGCTDSAPTPITSILTTQPTPPAERTPSPIPDPTPALVVPPTTSPESTPGPSVSADSTAAPTVSRGINATPSPISIGVLAPATSDTTPSPSSTSAESFGYADASCGTSDEFLITASEAPEIEGVYTSVDTSSYNLSWYSQTGRTDLDQTFVATLSPEDIWLVVFLSEDDDGHVTHCKSNEDSATAHPTDATWECDLNRGLIFDDVEDGEFSVDCKVTPTPAPTTGTSAGAPKCQVSVVVMASAAFAMLAELAASW